MASLDLNTFLPANLAERTAHLVDTYRTARRQRAAYRQSVAELQSLSDRDLADLDIKRSDINRIAREAADRV